MQKNHRYFILLFTATMLLFSAVQPILALETTYPNVPGAPTITDGRPAQNGQPAVPASTYID